jgi:hypothetical protein
MQDTTEKIQWHSAFYDAIKAELDEYRQHLTFITEHQLTTEPLRIDLLIVRKPSDIKIEKNIARIFLKDNILEYKSPDDSLTVGDYFKVFAYAYLYAYLQEIDIRDLTITFVSTMHPDSLFTYLNEQPDIISVEKISNGLYYIHNQVMPVQILVTKYLSDEENIWLTSLVKNISGKQFEKVVRERLNLSVKINTLLYALLLANPNVLEEGFRNMGITLETALDEIGYVDKRVLVEAQEEIAEIKKKSEQDKVQAELRIAQVEQDKAQAEQDKARAEQDKARAEQDKARAEQEKAEIYEKLKESARDMLRMGTPISFVLKWTSLREDEILSLNEDIGFSSEPYS